MHSLYTCLPTEQVNCYVGVGVVCIWQAYTTRQNKATCLTVVPTSLLAKESTGLIKHRTAGLKAMVYVGWMAGVVKTNSFGTILI